MKGYLWPQIRAPPWRRPARYRAGGGASATPRRARRLPVSPGSVSASRLEGYPRPMADPTPAQPPKPLEKAQDEAQGRFERVVKKLLETPPKPRVKRPAKRSRTK